MDPRQEYELRRTRWRKAEVHYERLHRRTGDLRLGLVVVLVVAAILLRRTVPLGFMIALLLVGIWLSGYIHDGILQRRALARRLMAFYQRGLDCINGCWAGKGSPGTEFLNKEHPFAIDLDVFGVGSLFELINTAQTKLGGATLAHWLLNRADRSVISDRQNAVAELRGQLDLREHLLRRDADPRARLDTDALRTWAAQPPQPPGAPRRIAAFCLPLLTWTLFTLGHIPGFPIAFAAMLLFAFFQRRRTKEATESMELRARDLWWLAELLGRLETEKFEAPMLRELQSDWKSGKEPASLQLRRLARLVDWMDSRDNYLFQLIGPFLLVKIQFALALDNWHARHASRLAGWLEAVGKMEALLSVAAYAYEHPEDIFPQLLTEGGSPIVEARGLAHPLILETVAVRNDVLLDTDHRLHVVSGSNMSGKSTWLRSIGINLILAMAGAPVRARTFRATPVQIAASIRTVDSLQEGVSRFYAEIQRLRQILQLAGGERPVVFLIDEILSGTNSHDRQIGAASIVKALVQRGAMGLITTHDLALTTIASETIPPGANFHFEDQLTNGKLTFDYRLQTGVVEKSNALELMRSIGLNV